MDTATRFDVADPTPRVNGKPRPMPGKRKGPTRRAVAAARTKDDLRRWGVAGVVVMATLSAALNGYANSLHAPAGWAGWVVGVLIPVIVLIIGKVAGLVYKRGFRRAAYAIGGIGTGLLLLSVWHCASSLAMLTGSPLLLTLPMAVAIDLGLVACEVASLCAE